MKTPTDDPFAGIADEIEPTGLDLRRELLDATRRAFAKVRKTAIQRPRAAGERAAMLPLLVRLRVALDLWLLVLALEPVLSEDDPLPIKTWAALLGGATPVSEATVTRAISTLRRLNLIEHRLVGGRALIRPKMEDGSGETYFRPGTAPEDGPGYFTIPHEYWLEGLCDTLDTPGKMALLIGLAETTQAPTWDVPTTRAQEWYGISERTLERGYRELSAAGLVLVREQRVRAPRAQGFMATVYHRALVKPYSMSARHAVQAKAKTDVSSTQARSIE